MTLTDGTGAMDMASFYDAWSSKLRPRLRRAGKLGDYACALEIQPGSGRLHGHFLLIDNSVGGGFIAQAKLAELAFASGFGHVVDIREVTDIPERQGEVSAYLTKGAHRVQTEAAGQVASYMAKAPLIAQLEGKSGARLRPYRVSMGWPLKLTEAQRRLVAEWYGGETDPGPWRMVQEARGGRFLAAEREHRRECVAGRVSLGSARRRELLIAGARAT